MESTSFLNFEFLRLIAGEMNGNAVGRAGAEQPCKTPGNAEIIRKSTVTDRLHCIARTAILYCCFSHCANFTVVWKRALSHSSFDYVSLSLSLSWTLEIGNCSSASKTHTDWQLIFMWLYIVGTWIARTVGNWQNIHRKLSQVHDFSNFLSFSDIFPHIC